MIIQSMRLMMMRWLPVTPTPRQEQATTELFMIYLIRSARIEICIHLSNSISPRWMKEGHFMPFILQGPNHVNAIASLTEAALQMSTENEGKKAWNWEKYVSWHVKHHLENAKEYGYQGLNPVMKVHYVLNGIRCNKLFTVVASTKAHTDNYEKNFNAVVTFLTQYIDKHRLTPAVKVISIVQIRPAK